MLNNNKVELPGSKLIIANNYVTAESNTPTHMVHLYDYNSDFKYLDNCFQTQSEDVNSLGSVYQYMGDNIEGAGNCFTSPYTVDINHEGSVFEYFLPEDEENTCHEPMYDSDYDIEAADFIGNKNCGTRNQIVIGQSCFVPINPTCNEIATGISYVNQEIINVTNDTQITEHVRSMLLIRLLRCKRYLTILKMRKCTITTFPKSPFDGGGGGGRIQAKFNSYLIAQGQYQDALNFLDTFYHVGEEMVDYVAVQEINIRRLIDQDTFQIDSSELALIRAAGYKSYPLAAYARGLLTALTGEIIYPNVVLADNATPRSIANAISTHIQVNPNPVHNILHINADNGNEFIRFELFDLKGRCAQKGEFTSSTKLDVSAIKPGLYILKLTSESNGVTMQKITKI